MDQSGTRSDFKEKFDTELVGNSSDIKKNGQNISQIAEVLYIEQYEKPFNLDFLSIESEKPWKKHLVDQLSWLMTTGHSGYAVGDYISLHENANISTLHHEIKHTKTLDTLKNNPEFKKRWEALAVDIEGNSLYLPKIQQIASRFKGLAKLVNGGSRDKNHTEENGFVTKYAGTNFYEDVAEIGELAEEFNGAQEMSRIILKDKNDLVKQKVELAQEYGLIVPEFLDYLELHKLYTDTWGSYGIGSLNATPKFLEASERFLEENPKSKYYGEIKFARATTFDANSYGKGENYLREVVIPEYYDSLTSPLKICGYSAALDDLKNIYDYRLNDQKTADIFQNAINLYYDLDKEGNLDLPIKGVNDYLTANGIDLE